LPIPLENLALMVTIKLWPITDNQFHYLRVKCVYIHTPSKLT